MRTFIALAAIVFATPSFAADAPKPAVTPILDESYSEDASKHAVVATAEWPVGADTGWHTHPGDEYATVLQGTVAIITKANGAQSMRTYKTGEAYHNVKGVVHDARNVGDGPARTLIVMIADKGKPLTIPAK